MEPAAPLASLRPRVGESCVLGGGQADLRGSITEAWEKIGRREASKCSGARLRGRRVAWGMIARKIGSATHSRADGFCSARRGAVSSWPVGSAREKISAMSNPARNAKGEFSRQCVGCRVSACARAHHSKGFCKKHLKAFERGRIDSAGKPIPSRCQLVRLWTRAAKWRNQTLIRQRERTHTRLQRARLRVLAPLAYRQQLESQNRCQR